ncbi:hypothetical protein GCM10023170_043490 [Phytohabitans houttuyneae]
MPQDDAGNRPVGRTIHRHDGRWQMGGRSGPTPTVVLQPVLVDVVVVLGSAAAGSVAAPGHSRRSFASSERATGNHHLHWNPRL